MNYAILAHPEWRERKKSKKRCSTSLADSTPVGIIAVLVPLATLGLLLGGTRGSWSAIVLEQLGDNQL